MRTIAVISLIFIFSAGCSDPHSAGTGSIIPSIVQDSIAQLRGEWFWVLSSGGIAGRSEAPTAEEQRTIIFTADSFFRSFHNGALVRSVKYRVGRGTSIYAADSSDMIRFADNSDPLILRRLTVDSLVLGDNYVDGFTSVYRRIGR